MPTIDKQVAASLDDARQATSIPWFSYTTAELYLSLDNNDSRTYERFAGVNIPKGATIIVAYLTFISIEPSDAGNIFNINGFLEDDVGNFPDIATADGYSLTEANVDWTPGAWSIGVEYNSPSLVAIVQEIVNQAGWAGDYIGFRTDTTTRTLNRSSRSYDYAGNDQGPRLHIEYNWSGKVLGVTKPAKVIGIEVANIAKVMGVA